MKKWLFMNWFMLIDFSLRWLAARGLGLADYQR
jgi:hypothetical protein